MTHYAFQPSSIPSLPVVDNEALFPVHRIFCVGQNYAAHTREMGGDPTRQPPFFFTKPGDAIVVSGGAIPYPSETENLHHEIELVVAIGKDGSDIPETRVHDWIYGFAVGIDLTRRDLQAEAKQKGRPWDTAKGFDNSAPCSPITQLNEIPRRGKIWLEVNGEPRQSGDLADMIWSVPEIISSVSKLFQLSAGDLIFTGTPSGVGPLLRGDAARGGMDGLGEIEIDIV